MTNKFNVKELTLDQIKKLTLDQVKNETDSERKYFEQEASEDKYREWYKIDNLRYDKPSIAMDNVILAYDKSNDSLKILLVVRKNRPFKGSLALPGGFMRKNESLENTVIREVKEETGLKLTNNDFEQLCTLSNPNRDYRGHVLSTSYITYLPEIRDIHGSSDVKNAQWVTLEINNDSLMLFISGNEIIKIPINLEESKVYDNLNDYYSSLLTSTSEYTPKIAFDHKLIILNAIKRIQNKLEYAPTALNLLGDSFTLNSARALFKKFNVGKKSAMINNSNFKKMYKNIIAETGETIVLKTKPEKLYRIK